MMRLYSSRSLTADRRQPQGSTANPSRIMLQQRCSVSSVLLCDPATRESSRLGGEEAWCTIKDVIMQQVTPVGVIFHPSQSLCKRSSVPAFMITQNMCVSGIAGDDILDLVLLLGERWRFGWTADDVIDPVLVDGYRRTMGWIS
jgi:hypothetical protein